MVPYKETAEEQLLRMIEGPQGPARELTPQSPGPMRPQVMESLNRFGMEMWRRLIRLKSDSPGADPLLWNSRVLSRVLWVVLVLLGGYVVFDLLLVQSISRAAAASQHRMPRTIGTSSQPVNPVKEPLRPASEYVERIGLRNPFTGSPSSQVSAKTLEEKLQEKIKDLVIVGIDRGTNPAVLIEDKAQGRTMAVTPGDEIRGMKVKKVTSEGVVFSYEGQEIILQ